MSENNFEKVDGDSIYLTNPGKNNSRSPKLS